MDGSLLPFDEAIATAATGDIWLFRGRSVADRAIQTLTNSPVNHVGMAVAQLVGLVVGLRSAVARRDRPGGRDPRDAGQPEELPSRAHGSRRLPAC